jgi:hypothetical protein
MAMACAPVRQIGGPCCSFVALADGAAIALRHVHAGAGAFSVYAAPAIWQGSMNCSAGAGRFLDALHCL